MVDLTFFMILLPLPMIVALGAIVYALAAWKTRTPRLRRARALSALWLLLGASVLFFARERVRSWADFDNAFAATVFISFAGFAVLLGAVLGFFALLGRSTRGAGLCPRCWYDMTGVAESDEATCPECGFSVRAQSDLTRRKRWPVLIALAIVVQLAGQFIYQLIRADHTGVNAFVPTTALVAAMYSLPRETIIGSGSTFDTDTLTGRLAGKGAADWQRKWALGKAIDGLSPGSSRETIYRAASILNRSKYAGEIPLSHWQAAMRTLCSSGNTVSESISYLTESYVRSRTSTTRNRFAGPDDPDLTQRELAPIVPGLFTMLKATRPRSSEWWDVVQLLVLAGPQASGVVEHLEFRILADESDNARASSALVLANLAGRFQNASGALTDAFQSLDLNERSRVLLALSRNAPTHPDLEICFRTLVGSGEPALENLGACGLACAPETRCEGVRLLLTNFERHAHQGAALPDIWSLYWPIVRNPDDDASDELVANLQNLALHAPPDVRLDAMTVLNSVARISDARNAQVVALFDLLGLDLDRVFAERARAAAKDLRAVGPIAPPRPVAVIRTNESGPVRTQP